jgi:L-fuconate dehydratase
MFGLLDSVLVSCIARINGCKLTPHASGSSLDEQSPHIQLFNLARVHPELNPINSLTENVGFCSRYFASPAIVNLGRAQTPSAAGLLVGLDPQVRSSVIDYKEGITWLEL